MTNEIVPVNDHKEEAPHNTKEFKGYSIEELRYQRALIALRKDYRVPACSAVLCRNP